jgi:hypothetical protein
MNEEHVMDCSVDGNHLTADLGSSSADFGYLGLDVQSFGGVWSSEDLDVLFILLFGGYLVAASRVTAHEVASIG